LRKYYRITAAGRAKYYEMLEELKELRNIIDYVSGGGKYE
jgi:DNA-binding PadR family transcriptional regulator